MRYFMDTKFIEDGKTIDLISIGIVCEDGRKHYAVNIECNIDKASYWVKENVLQPMGIDCFGKAHDCQYIHQAYDNIDDKLTKFSAHSKEKIKDDILKFVGWTKDGFNPYFDNLVMASGNVFTDDCFVPEFWADYCSYDWVCFCQLFGKMIDLPQGFPMYCNDIQQLWRMKGCPELPKQKSGQHNALEDAKYVRELYQLLIDK